MRPRLIVPSLASTVTSIVVVSLIVSSASPASAAVTVSRGDVNGDDLDNTIVLTCAGGLLTDTLSGGSGDTCASIQEIGVNPGLGVDRVDLSHLNASAFPALQAVRVFVEEPITTHPDVVVGSVFEDSIKGDSTDVVDAGPGDDTIDGASTASGGPGDDTFSRIFDSASGGEGDDRFIQFAAYAGIDGGPGHDSWELNLDQSQASLPVPLVLTLTPAEMRVAVGALDVTSPITSVEHVTIGALRGGEQTLDGATFPGTLHLKGFGGPDRLIGGALDDVLEGGSGNDVVIGGPGRDLLTGGADDDRIEARDGTIDLVNCGAGTDTVVADAGDVLDGCEDVQLPAATPSPPASPVGPPPAVPPATPAPAAAPVTGKVKGAEKVVKGRKVTFRFSSKTDGAAFQCKVDGRRWGACSSPFRVSTKKLKKGKHVVRVRAVLAGKVDATPSRLRFRVTAPRRR